MLKKNKIRISNRSLFFIVLLFCLFAAEAVLRMMGYQAGMLSPNWLNFKEVDSLEVYNSFYANEKGFFVADSGYFKNQYSINNEGFRSKAFVRDSTKKNILFLGDSYTWGSQAEPMSHCFVELVEKEGFNVFNTGIPGADPPQYEAIARTYIPQLKPDVVCLMFYAGNDFIAFDRHPEPFHNIYYITNAGWLSPYINNQYTDSPQKVYDYYLEKYHVGKQAPLWKRIVAKSVIGTLLMSIPVRLQERKAWQKNTTLALHYVDAIQQICDANHAAFKLFLIPLHTEISDQTQSEYNSIFKNMKVNIPEDITRNDFYNWPNGHLNNEGHAKYARCILKVIKRK